MYIHPNNVPHLHEIVESSFFKIKGRIIGYTGVFPVTLNKFQPPKPLYLIHLDKGYSLSREKGEPYLFVEAVLFAPGNLKLINCNCNHSKEDFDQ